MKVDLFVWCDVGLNHYTHPACKARGGMTLKIDAKKAEFSAVSVSDISVIKYNKIATKILDFLILKLWNPPLPHLHTGLDQNLTSHKNQQHRFMLQMIQTMYSEVGFKSCLFWVVRQA